MVKKDLSLISSISYLLSLIIYISSPKLRSMRPYEKVLPRLLQLHKEYPPSEWKWIVSYSGGKDSSALLNSVLKFAGWQDFNFEVLHHNTLVEYPIMDRHVSGVLSSLRKKGIKTHVTYPKKHFFEYMIEQNYTFPRWNFRWCCRLLKWQPTTEFLEKQGKTLNLIAVRGDEINRPNMFIRPQNLNYMRKKLINVNVASPLVDLTIDDVWKLCNKSTRKIYSLNGYSASNVRFGCWVCTVSKCETLNYYHPELARMKYELVRARCKGLNELISKLKEYNFNINITNNSTNNEKHPCNTRCEICEIKKWKERAAKSLKPVETLSK